MAVNYRDLTVYKKARELVIGVDRLIKGFPPTPPARAIATQMFASATSIGANIAEGKAKGVGREYLRYVIHAQGSANETDHWLHTVLDCELAATAQVEPLLALVLEILKILSTARVTLSRQIEAPRPRVREAPAGYSMAGQEVVNGHNDVLPIDIDPTDEAESYAPLAPDSYDFIDPLELDNP
jgi:four helix bundle protein